MSEMEFLVPFKNDNLKIFFSYELYKQLRNLAIFTCNFVYTTSYFFDLHFLFLKPWPSNSRIFSRIFSDGFSCGRNMAESSFFFYLLAFYYVNSFLFLEFKRVNLLFQDRALLSGKSKFVEWIFICYYWFMET